MPQFPSAADEVRPVPVEPISGSARDRAGVGSAPTASGAHTILTNSISTDAARLRALGQAIQILGAITPDYDDPAQEAALYRTADIMIALAIATPARDLAGVASKAEMAAWCCASRTDFGLGETAQARVIASLLRDLLAIG